MPGLEEKLLGFFAGRGCEVPAIALLQPADPFLDTAGEDLRRRIFITADRDGVSLCLRPEFTIPVCMHHLASGNAATRYAYGGSVFRQRENAPSEFQQAGIEDIGNGDRTAADAAAILDCAQALEAAGAKGFEFVMGDQAVFEAVLDALGLPEVWRARLGRDFGDMALLKNDLHRLERGGISGTENLPPEVGKLVDGGDRAGVTQWIAGKLEEGGLAHSGGRTAAEIADRLFEKAELAAFRLEREKLAALNAFLEIKDHALSAIDRLHALAREYMLDLGVALENFAARLDALAGADLDPHYVAAFGRRLDYYTGLVFEMTMPGGEKPVAGGGRYDRLMGLLGAPEPVPAVGFSIWVDRLPGEGAS